jgi:ribonuclease HI
MELKAVIEGLCLLNEASKVKIITDSKYVANTINRGNLRAYANTPNRKNADMWQKIAKLSEWHTLSAEWVKGHAGNHFNQRCDNLANAEACKVAQEKRTRQIVFRELLKDITIPAKTIAKMHNLSLNTVEKYYRQYLDKYSVGGI